MKKISFLIALLLWSFSGFAQENKTVTALIVIDIQDFYFPGGDVPLHNPEAAALNASHLIKNFRQKNIPVIFIRHNYQPGGAIYKSVLPGNNEKVISKSEVSSFNGTDLDEYLKSLGVTELVICGMQTHMCVEAATRAGYDLGYKCTLVEDACTTRNLKYGDKTVLADDVQISTLATLKSYAKVVTTKEYLSEK